MKPPTKPGKKMQEEMNKGKGTKKGDMQKCHGGKKK